MILGDTGPVTTMHEDLDALNLSYLVEDAAPAAAPVHEGEMPEQFKKGYKKNGNGKKPNGKMSKGDDYKGDDDDDDDKEMGEGRRTEVPVRTEDEAPVYELDEAAQEELEAALIAYAEHEGFDQDDYDAMIEDADFIHEFATVLFFESEDDEELAPKLEAALHVIEMFYGALEQVSEGEGERPSYDDLVGVIESFECVMENANDALEQAGDVVEELLGEDGTLDEGKKRTAGLRALRRARKVQKRMKKRGKVKKSTLKAAKKGKRSIGGKLVKVGGAQEKMALRGQLKGASARSKKNIRKKMKAAKGHSAQGLKQWARGKKLASGEEQQGAAISELVQDLADLREAVTGQADAGTATEELLNGLQSVHETATTFYETIASELKEAEEIDEDDARIVMGRHLESIAADAATVANQLAEGKDEEHTLEDYADDLQALAADLSEAMETMKEIE